MEASRAKQDTQWGRGRLESSERRSVVGGWLLALFWIAVSSTVFLFVPEELRKGNTIALLALVFPLAGAGILLWALRATIRWRKFGTSVLELSNSPISPGSELRGRLLTRMAAPPERMRLVLTCVSRDHTSENTSDTIQWLAEQAVEAHLMRREVEGTVVPVSFTLLPNAPQSARNPQGTSILWQLHASAAVPGVDYHSRFELPIMHVDEGVHEPQPGSAAARALDVPLEPGRIVFDPARATVRVSETSRGCEFYFGPGRNPGAAASFAVVCAIFLGSTWLLSRLGAPAVFPIVCGAFALVLLMIVLHVAVGTSRVEITSHEIVVRQTLLRDRYHDAHPSARRPRCDRHGRPVTDGNRVAVSARMVRHPAGAKERQADHAGRPHCRSARGGMARRQDVAAVRCPC